jgi:hypothetical protein
VTAGRRALAVVAAASAAGTATVSQVLDGHVTLEVECLYTRSTTGCRSLLAANTPPASPQLRQALGVIDRSVGDYIRNAGLEAA